ncbi:unnamed protein product [Toxocara canis]|uniref:G_PROTEIN_RECEP_F1_2 domain-containing protein n=1 Tax=Toxocara canis TaxID=6265 RepID=A0A183VEP8_TOXCA|nr:unnamed protein product [Toxocara canis]
MSIAPRNDVSSNPLSSIVNFTITDCEFAKEMSTSSIIVALRVAQLVLCLMGFFSSVPFIYVLCSQTAHQLHVNVRLSLISLTVGAVFACFQLFISAFYTLMQTLISEDACDFMVDSYVCALIRSPILFAIYSTILGSMVLAAERAIATIHFKTYESHGSVYVGITLVLFQWLIALGLTVFVVGIRLSPGHVLYCSIYISHPRSAIYSITMISVMETVALLLSFVLLKINQRKRVSEFINNSLHSLTERYQLQENIRMMQILIPTMTVHAVLSILCLIALFIFAFFDK